MKSILLPLVAIFVLTSAFTCSKNPPVPQNNTAETESQPAQEQMAAPVEGANPQANPAPSGSATGTPPSTTAATPPAENAATTENK